MSYSAEVLADSPVVYYDFTSGSTSFPVVSGASASTLALDAINNTGPTAHNTGGPTGGGWLEFGASQGNIHTSNTITGPNHGTVEFWFRYASAPAANLTLACFAPNSGSAGDAMRVILRTDGKLQADLWVGSVSSLTSTSVISTNTWHHVVFTWGSTVTRRIRVDKVDAITGSSVNSSPAANEAFRLHGRWSGAANAEQTGAVDIGPAAYYSTALTNTRSDIHYDAAFVISGSFAATLPHPSLALTGTHCEVGSFGLTLPKPTVALAGTYTPFQPTGDFDLSLPVPVVALTGDYHALETGAFNLTLPKPVLDLAGDYTDPPHPIGTFDAVLPKPVVALVGAYSGPSPSDTGNDFDGLSFGGYGITLVEAAVTSPPTPPTATRVDKAIALPVPVLVKGRPT